VIDRMSLHPLPIIWNAWSRLGQGPFSALQTTHARELEHPADTKGVAIAPKKANARSALRGREGEEARR
jgi:hypothetical protein